ncbi:MAG: FMN-binding protein [Spirochaetes bacterium]|nr:FMN-binding protein [Spirochaetota bacterium]
MKVKKTLIIVAAVIAVLAVAAGILKAELDYNLRTFARTIIHPVDLGQIADGTYEGSFSIFPISVKLKVTVQDHTITGFDLLKHRNGQGKPAEVLLAEAVVKQKIDLDVIAGATYSSKAIMKAMENALAAAVSKQAP